MKHHRICLFRYGINEENDRKRLPGRDFMGNLTMKSVPFAIEFRETECPERKP